MSTRYSAVAKKANSYLWDYMGRDCKEDSEHYSPFETNHSLSALHSTTNKGLHKLWFSYIRYSFKLVCQKTLECQVG